MAQNTVFRSCRSYCKLFAFRSTELCISFTEINGPIIFPNVSWRGHVSRTIAWFPRGIASFVTRHAICSRHDLLSRTHRWLPVNSNTRDAHKRFKSSQELADPIRRNKCKTRMVIAVCYLVIMQHYALTHAAPFVLLHHIYDI